MGCRTVTDLFTPDSPDELEYAANLARQVQLDLETVMAQGRIPAHIELDSILQKDELRLLDLIETRGGYVMGTDVTVQYGCDSSGLFAVPVTRRVDSLTVDCGFISPGNCKATVNRCIAEGWIVEGVDVSGRVRYDLTRMGRWAKDLAETDLYWEEMED